MVARRALEWIGFLTSDLLLLVMKTLQVEWYIVIKAYKDFFFHHEYLWYWR